MKASILPVLVLGFLAISTETRAGPVGSSIGVCTRKDEFAKRLSALDPKVAELSAARDEPKRKKAAAALVKMAEADIEALMRYREASLAPVFAEVLAKSKKWYTRSRAACALKMLNVSSAVPALGRALDDADPLVREQAASALGHLGGEEAKEALGKRRAKEKDPFVLATLDAAIGVAGGRRPYGERADGKVWSETLEGAEGARRVAFAWAHKGTCLFSDYDAKVVDYPVAESFAWPVQKYREDLFAGYPRNSFGAGGTHAGEDCAWFREGCGYYAIADGVVRMVQGAGGDWGFLVVLEHRLPDGHYITSVYGHAAFDVLVKPGEVVRLGQKIATQGFSTSIENGGYGSHLHFGLGDGPFRRPAGMAEGEQVDVDLGEGVKGRTAVLRLVYAEEKNSFGFPLTAFVVANADGSERTVTVPEQPVKDEIGWFKAYVKDCRGWLDPQKLLPELVEGKGGRAR
jgi:murein DD-endopeptidase MepM/ murein hydrolase activator NlpD